MTVSRGMHKEDVIHIHNEILLSYNKNKRICTNMDGPRDFHVFTE